MSDYTVLVQDIGGEGEDRTVTNITSVISMPMFAASGGWPTAYQGPIFKVSPFGILTALMRDDVAVEMTIDKAIRVVNYRHSTVAATNSSGDSSCVYHPFAQVYSRPRELI